MRLLLAGDIRAVHLRRYAEYFKNKGHTTVTASLEIDDRHFPDYRIRSLKAPMAIKYPLSIFSFKKAVRNFKPDLINCHFIPNYGLLGVMSGFHPLAVSVWGSDLLISAQKSALHRKRARDILLKSDLILCDALMLSSRAEKITGGKKRILTVPYGVEKKYLDAGIARKIKANPPYRLISTRRMEKLYRVGDFITAVGRLQKQSDYEMIIIGDGSELTGLKNLAVTSNFDPGTFKGAMDHDSLMDELRGADIYISCSESDSTSVSLLEAMALGVFPVVSDIEGNREWIKDGHNGFLFPVGDTNMLAEKIGRASADLELRKSAIQYNFELVRRKAFWDENMAAVEKEFEALVG